MEPTDRTFGIGERALELMRSYCTSASPQSYELWFTYVSGLKPLLNEDVKRLLKGGQKLAEAQVGELYDKYLSRHRLAVKAETAGLGMVSEISQVMELLDTALGSTARYDASLKEIAADLAEPGQGSGLREILGSLVHATQEIASTNRALENRLRDSRSEIENLRETLDEVRIESLTDALTGISNRKHFESSLVVAAETARTTGQPLALIVIDIDNFKHFNDVHGHLTGDQVLRLISTAMGERVEGKGMLARFGGEEFAIILPGASREVAFACAESVRCNVETRELIKRSTAESLGRITVSLGIAMLAQDETATSLLERADNCMYQAKRAGRNRTAADWDDGEAAPLPAVA